MNKSHSKYSQALGTIKCPKCGEKGQLKKRTLGCGFQYLQVDHYKNPSWHGNGYLRSCYLAKITEV